MISLIFTSELMEVAAQDEYHALFVIALGREDLKLLMAKLYIRFLIQSRRSNRCDLLLLLLHRVFSKFLALRCASSTSSVRSLTNIGPFPAVDFNTFSSRVRVHSGRVRGIQDLVCVSSFVGGFQACIANRSCVEFAAFEELPL